MLKARLSCDDYPGQYAAALHRGTPERAPLHTGGKNPAHVLVAVQRSHGYQISSSRSRFIASRSLKKQGFSPEISQYGFRKRDRVGFDRHMSLG